MKNLHFSAVVALLMMTTLATRAQNFLEQGQVNGNVQIDAQYYSEDDKLGITDSLLNFRKFGLNAFSNVIYTNGDFSAGLRLEGYLNPMLGFDDRYEGIGVPYWFAKYKVGTLEMTAGHFYEQFGSGLILRSWEEWTLGYDNNFYGFNARFSPYKGIMLKGLVGTQRYFWEPYEAGNRGIVKGFDGDFYLNEMFDGIADAKTKISLGGSFVSKYEKTGNVFYTRNREFLVDSIPWIETTTYEMTIPHNVGSWAARTNIAHGGFNFYGEYARKGADPNATNNYIYREGSAVYSTLSYSTKGLGIFLATKWIDNMSYKSKLSESGNPSMLDINYLPAISKEHQYSMATMYPYATQPNGEFGLQGQVIYTIPKKSAIGGRYGTPLTFNYALAKSIEKDSIYSDVTGGVTGTEGYNSNFFSIGDLTYYQDLNLTIDKKFSPKVKAKAAYFHQTYNLHVIEDNLYDDKNMVYANIGVLDVTYKFNSRNSLRAELQGLFTKEDDGDWLALMLEYNVSPTWFFSIQDEFNYGNPVDDKQVHYYNVSFGYTQKSNRFSVRYGRQREGLLCVGGVCRYVPASTGLTLTITSSF
ncbi:MAG: hypothetical protein GX103_15370 [Bacteroidales bacterium]|nr:hypothetical protein [Bacteroidales bacterium]